MRALLINICFFIGILRGNVFAQSDKQIENKKANIDITDINYSSLMLGSDYSSNTSTFGKFNGNVSQPSLSPYLSFYHKWGLFFNGIVNIIAYSDSAAIHSTYQVNLKGGYQLKLGEKFTITPSYTRYMYDDDALTISTLYSNYVEATLDYQSKYLYSSLSAGYLWGRIDEFSVDSRVGASYDWDNVLFKEDALTIQLTLAGIFNNPNYLSKVFTFLNDYAKANPTATRDTLIKSMLKWRPGPVVRTIRQTLRNDPLLRWMARDYIPQDVTLLNFLEYNNRFTITSVITSFLVSYSIGNATLNVDYSLYRMVNQPVYASNKYYHYLTAGLSYSFNW
jgi:hypothetical protein